MKKITLILLTIFITCFFSLQAQGKRQRQLHKVEDMHENKWKSIVEQTKLTLEEQNALKPNFLEFEKSIWIIHEERINTVKNLIKSKNNGTVDYELLNDKYINSEIKQAQLLRDYHLKLKKILKPERLFKYYQAERMFKRKLLRSMPPPPEEGNN